MGFLPGLATTYMGWGRMLIRGLLLGLTGFLLLQFGLRASSRAALFTAAFWQTFAEYARYRRKRLWPILPILGGLILLIWGAVFVFEWVLAYYAARLGHPVGLD